MLRGIFKIFFLLFVFGIIGVIIILGYFGFFPGLSTVFGSNQPRDLGVRYTEEDLASGNEKSGVVFGVLPQDTPNTESVVYSGEQSINDSFTDEELTAMMNNCTWKYCPFSDVQIRVGADNSVEFSALFHVDRLDGYAERFYLDENIVKTVKSALKISGKQTPVYFVGSPSVSEDQVTLKVESAEVGRFPVPAVWVNDYQDDAETFLEGQFSQVPGFSLTSVRFSEGKLFFDGTYPESEYVVTE